MHFLPGSRRIRFKLYFNQYMCWLNNVSATSSFSNICLLDNCLQDRLTFDVCLPCQFPISKKIHTGSNQDFDDDTEAEEEEIKICVKSLEIEERSESFRNSLYPSCEDPVIVKLKSCYTIQNLREIICNNDPSSMTTNHYCQFILVLWDILKNYNQLSHDYIDGYTTNDKYNSAVGQPQNNLVLNTNNNDIHQSILKALDHLSRNSESLRIDELVLSVLYLNRLGIHLKNPSIQSMLQRIYKLLASEDLSVLPLSLLSRLTLIFVDYDELWTKFVLIKTLPFVYKYFDECSNVEDFKALTISMLSTSPFLSEEVLVEYEALTEEMLRNGELTKDQHSVIVKTVMLLNRIYYKPSARLMIYRLLQMLSGQLNNLFPPHLINLKRITSFNLEPQFTLSELQQIKKIGYAQIPSVLYNSQNFFFFTVVGLHDKEDFTIVKDLVNQADTLDKLFPLCYILTTADVDTCHLYWGKIASLLSKADSSAIQYICIRYMVFTNRMGFYRHKPFEKQMLTRITSELVTGSAAHRPNQFSILAAFVLSYERNKHEASSLALNIIPRLLSMAGQLNANSCFMLSKVFKQPTAYKVKTGTLQAYLQLNSALDVRTKELLDAQENLSPNSLNTLLRICINKKDISQSDVLWDIFKRCERLDWSQLTSRSLRNLVYNCLNMSCFVPTALDRMAEYCLTNRHVVVCGTVGKLAHLCYHVGHSPACGTSFWTLVGDLAMRDYKNQNGLNLLQVALALSFFNHLPSSLNSVIFSVDFLERLDQEIKSCFDKDKYPMRVKHTLMQLNRSVCLDNPEADVPWFHSRFCEELQSLGKLDTKLKTLFFTDVSNTLSGLVGDVSHVGQNILTPYGYHVDFQLNLDSDLNPLPLRDAENVAHKIAMLLYYKHNFTTYERKLKGYHQMKQRHLEILGYKVVGLEDSMWNAMWMTEATAKHEYLRNIIWPS